MPKSFISNYKSLAKTKLRKDALAILESGIKAINTGDAIRRAVKLKRKTLYIGRRRYPLNKYRRVIVIGIGKAAFEAAVELEKMLGPTITDGVVLDVKGGKLKRIKSVVGSHPLPSMPNMRATGDIIGILKDLDSRDLLITIVSGGGSSLLCWPYGLKCEDLSMITDVLIKKGATIREMNTVRKHLSEIQGGQFARMAYPATVIGLIFSDVPGDELGMVASGPTVLDKTTADDASRILVKYDVLKHCQLPDCEVKETPKDPKLFEHVQNVLVVSNKVATKAMLAKARKLGYVARVHSTEISGEARKVGKKLASLSKKGTAIIAAGESTVTVEGDGKGGRNQEVALGAFEHLKKGALVLSCTSDGVDNSPVAGAIMDQIVIDKAKEKGLDPKKYLKDNNSYEFFQNTKSYIRTGVTGVNVSDLMISIRSK